MKKIKKFLYIERPECFIDWDQEKNTEIDIYSVTSGSKKEIWWNCPKCQSSYNSNGAKYYKGERCPYCHGRKVNHTNSLAALFPSVAKE